jgi:hypothetical protein
MLNGLFPSLLRRKPGGGCGGGSSPVLDPRLHPERRRPQLWGLRQVGDLDRRPA